MERFAKASKDPIHYFKNNATLFIFFPLAIEWCGASGVDNGVAPTSPASAQ